MTPRVATPLQRDLPKVRSAPNAEGIRMQHDGARTREGIELRLVVWMSRESGWRVSVFEPDASERVFVSPFELARFLAWPLAPAERGGSGLR